MIAICPGLLSAAARISAAGSVLTAAAAPARLSCAVDVTTARRTAD